MIVVFCNKLSRNPENEPWGRLKLEGDTQRLMVKNLRKWISPAAIAVLAITACQAKGAERTWTGGNNTEWNKKQNWTSSANSAPTATDVAVFTGGDAATTRQPTINAVSTILRVDFRSAGWTISAGSTLTVTGTNNIGINNSATTGTNTVHAAIALGDSQTWTVAGGGTLVATGTISGAQSLTKAGAGTLT